MDMVEKDREALNQTGQTGNNITQAAVIAVPGTAPHNIQQTNNTTNGNATTHNKAQLNTTMPTIQLNTCQHTTTSTTTTATQPKRVQRHATRV